MHNGPLTLLAHSKLLILVGEPGCQDSVDITITVTEGSTFENPEPGIVCETDVQTIFDGFTPLRITI